MKSSSVSTEFLLAHKVITPLYFQSQYWFCYTVYDASYVKPVSYPVLPQLADTRGHDYGVPEPLASSSST